MYAALKALSFSTKQCLLYERQNGTLEGEYDPSSNHILLHSSRLLLPKLLFLSLALLAV